MNKNNKGSILYLEAYFEHFGTDQSNYHIEIDSMAWLTPAQENLCQNSFFSVLDQGIPCSVSKAQLRQFVVLKKRMETEFWSDSGQDGTDTAV